jgi:AbrB family looped-hinge helix DNA binding protein
MTNTKARLGKGGRLVIPAGIRKSMGVGEGDELILNFDKGELKVCSRRLAVKRAQALVRKFVPADRDLVSELIRERREEAARD